MNYRNAICLLFLFLSSVCSYADELTHLGINPTDHITLRGVRSRISQECLIIPNPDPNECGALFQTFPNGRIGSEPFVIPIGKILVVTDLDWHYTGNTSEAADRIGSKGVVWLVRAGETGSNRAMVSTGTIHENCGDNILTQCADAYGQVQATSGFIVFPGATLSFNTQGLPFNPCISEDCSEAAFVEVLIRGYLLTLRANPVTINR